MENNYDIINVIKEKINELEALIPRIVNQQRDLRRVTDDDVYVRLTSDDHPSFTTFVTVNENHAERYVELTEHYFAVRKQLEDLKKEFENDLENLSKYSETASYRGVNEKAPAFNNEQILYGDQISYNNYLVALTNHYFKFNHEQLVKEKAELMKNVDSFENTNELVRRIKNINNKISQMEVIDIQNLREQNIENIYNNTLKLMNDNHLNLDLSDVKKTLKKKPRKRKLTDLALKAQKEKEDLAKRAALKQEEKKVKEKEIKPEVEVKEPEVKEPEVKVEPKEVQPEEVKQDTPKADVKEVKQAKAEDKVIDADFENLETVKNEKEASDELKNRVRNYKIGSGLVVAGVLVSAFLPIGIMAPIIGTMLSAAGGATIGHEVHKNIAESLFAQKVKNLFTGKKAEIVKEEKEVVDEKSLFDDIKLADEKEQVKEVVKKEPVVKEKEQVVKLEGVDYISMLANQQLDELKKEEDLITQMAKLGKEEPKKEDDLITKFANAEATKMKLDREKSVFDDIEIKEKQPVVEQVVEVKEDVKKNDNIKYLSKDEIFHLGQTKKIENFYNFAYDHGIDTKAVDKLLNTDELTEELYQTVNFAIDRELSNNKAIKDLVDYKSSIMLNPKSYSVNTSHIEAISNFYNENKDDLNFDEKLVSIDISDDTMIYLTPKQVEDISEIYEQHKPEIDFTIGRKQFEGHDEYLHIKNDGNTRAVEFTINDISTTQKGYELVTLKKEEQEKEKVR